MSEIDARIPLMARSPEIMMPYDLISGAQNIKANQNALAEMDRKNKNRNALAMLYQKTGGNPEQLRAGLINQGMGDQVPEFDSNQAQVQQETLKTAIQRMGYVAQMIAPFIDAQPTPETAQAYQQTLAQIENDLGTQSKSLPRNYDPGAIKTAYQQGMSTLNNLNQEYNFISANTGMYAANKGNGQIQRMRDPETGEPLIAPNADPNLKYNMSRAGEAPKGFTATDEQGREFRTSQEAANPRDFGLAANVIQNGIAPIESGGQPNPARATNPYSSAYGATQVTDATQQDSGFPMPEFPKNGTAEEQKSWSATLYNHYLRVFNGDQNKATQAWHDGVSAVQQGRPDTGYTDKVNSRLGGIVKSPSIAEKEQAKADVQTKQKVAETQAMAKQELPKAIETADYTIKLLDELKSHPGLKIAVGTSSILNADKIPGTDASDFKTRLDQLQGQQFLNAYNVLKGGGQITEVEGKKATEAMARLSTAQTEGEFLNSLNELKGVLTRAKGLAEQKAGIKNKQQRTTEDLLRLYGGE
jgi:hypothetical protein